MRFLSFCFFVFFKQKTAYEMRISDWSSDVCSSDLHQPGAVGTAAGHGRCHAGDRRHLRIAAVEAYLAANSAHDGLSGPPCRALTCRPLEQTTIGSAGGFQQNKKDGFLRNRE